MTLYFQISSIDIQSTLTSIVLIISLLVCGSAYSEFFDYERHVSLSFAELNMLVQVIIERFMSFDPWRRISPCVVVLKTIFRKS